jgi:hypothetical protein
MTPFSGIPIRIDPNNFDRPVPRIALSTRLFSLVIESNVADPGFSGVPGSGFAIGIRVQEGKDPQK